MQSFIRIVCKLISYGKPNLPVCFRLKDRTICHATGIHFFKCEKLQVDVAHRTVEHTCISFTVHYAVNDGLWNCLPSKHSFCLSWVLSWLVKDLLLKFSNFPLHGEILLFRQNIFHGWRIFKESKLVIDKILCLNNLRSSPTTTNIY